MELALEAAVSTRHLSFVETGRSKPSREMVVRLAEHLDVPLRERNELLLAAGYAPAYAESSFEDAGLGQVRDAVRRLLAAHEPYPAIAVDRRWELVDGNAGIPLMTAGCAAHLLEPPINALRLTLHPEGMAPQIANLAEWRGHLLAPPAPRGQRHPGRRSCARCSPSWRPTPAARRTRASRRRARSSSRCACATRAGELSFMSTITTFGTPLDITVSELSIEAFFPADDHTAQVLRAALPTKS